MSLQFITGASGAGKSTYIYRQIIARSEKEPEGRFFILVPDQFTMQTQKDLVSLHTVPYDQKDRFKRAQFMDVDPEHWVK